MKSEKRVFATRLPITIIGGFLGVGKTTLVNNILVQANGSRFVVFVNDFGAIDIDHDLIETVAEDRVSLKNGCVCCSLNNDLVGKVSEFAHSDDPPDAIFIEVSGVADSRSLSTSFDALEAAGLARLDARVYVMDADNFHHRSFEDAEQIIDQAVSSDLVLLNKTDLADSKWLNELENTLSESAPYSKILHTAYCDVPLDLIVNVSESSTGAVTERILEKSVQGHNHGERYQQWSYETNQSIDRRRFEEFVKQLPDHCLRAKGLLHFTDEPGQVYQFNFVGYRASLDKPAKNQLLKHCRIVAVGYRSTLQVSFLNEIFEETLCHAEKNDYSK
ncbi:MAG: hypothetical protein GKR96_13615 [Gammaproteobacteria bacterium]|nr:hypothetical protein [Gammaproteobacteria bacterium]